RRHAGGRAALGRRPAGLGAGDRPGGRPAAPRATGVAMRRSVLGSLGAVLTVPGVHLRRVVRDRTALVFTLVLPLAIILVVGSAFGGDQAFKVGVIDKDDTAASRALVAALDRNGALRVERYGSLDSLRPDVRLNSGAAGVVNPARCGTQPRPGCR